MVSFPETYNDPLFFGGGGGGDDDDGGKREGGGGGWGERSFQIFRVHST